MRVRTTSIAGSPLMVPTAVGVSTMVGRSPSAHPAVSMPSTAQDMSAPVIVRCRRREGAGENGSSAGRNIVHERTGRAAPLDRPPGDPVLHRLVVSLSRVIRLDAATVLLQWATGGLFFLWLTTRRREVGLGYGWLLRGTYLLMAVGALAFGLAFGVVPVREISSALVIVVTALVLGASIVMRRAGVSGADAEHDRRT